MAFLPRHLQALRPEPSELRLEQVERIGNLIFIVVATTRPTVSCPLCQTLSGRIHSRYERVLRDLPWHGSIARLRLRCRRFYCRSPECSRKIFTERLPKVARRYGRSTERSRQTLALIGYALGGEAGARLAERLGLETTADTILRTLKNSAPNASPPPVRVVGVDDWAWRKGQRYGTILVDLERHKVVGLLADRSAESVAQWLKQQPGIEVVARDRAGLYAEGATKGAPDAVQVADRFHLLCNLTAAAERALQQKRFTGFNKSLLEAPPTVESKESPEPASQTDEIKAQRRERRLERYNEVIRLYREGHSQKTISSLLGLQRKTIRRFLRAGEFPERSKPKRQPSRVNRFRTFLEKRWAEGCHNATQLWREVCEQGYEGARGMVARMISSFRAPGTKYFRASMEQRKLQRRFTIPSPSHVASLFSRRPETLSGYEKAFLKFLEAEDSGIWALRSITYEFSTLMRNRDLNGLTDWMHRAIATGIPAMKSFVKGLRRDQAAVDAAFSLPWSSGQVEGQVHRLKLIKRQMYGRAGFALLHRRVLPFTLYEEHRAP